MSILFIISSLPSSILYGYVLSQLLSLLTRSCAIKYNTGTYQHRLCLAEWCRAILIVIVNSNWLALSATLIILQVRESASSRCSQEWISPRLLALVANCLMHLMRTFIEESLCLCFGILVMTRKSTCDLLLCRSRSISHKARDPKSKGRRQLLIVSPVIPGVTAILFLR